MEEQYPFYGVMCCRECIRCRIADKWHRWPWEHLLWCCS